MGWRIWQQISRKNLPYYATLRELFQILSVSFLGLLFPLSFLLLARLSTADLYLPACTTSTPQPSSLLYFFILYTYPSLLLHATVSLNSVAAFICGLTCRTNSITTVRELPCPVFRPRLSISCIFLFTLHVCIGLGIEGTIAVGNIDGSIFGHETSLVSRVVFFLGMHEPMLYWSRTIVKPVVDETVFGFAREERWVERVAVAASFGGLWWWKLRDEVESLVVVTVVKRELLIDVSWPDILGWWLYYLTIMIGIVSGVKGLIWLGMGLFCRRLETNHPAGGSPAMEEENV